MNLDFRKLTEWGIESVCFNNISSFMILVLWSLQPPSSAVLVRVPAELRHVVATRKTTEAPTITAAFADGVD